MKVWFKEKFIPWIKAAGIRAIKTVAQTALASLTTALGTGVLLGDVDWPAVIGTAVVAGIYSLLTSVAGLPEIKQGQEMEDELEIPDGCK